MNAALYQIFSSSQSSSIPNFLDITQGTNGTPATSGFDLVTGLGSVIGNNLILSLAAY